MNDPYRTLGITPNATDEEVKDAYKTLLQMYNGNTEKINEITNAFDFIMNSRRGSFEQFAADGFVEIRHQLQNGNYNDADSMLDTMTERTAEWYFLKGSTCYAKGWLDEAYSHFTQACKMEPYNQEYASALKHMSASKGGFMKGNPNQNTNNDSGYQFCCCDTCDICEGLICADCCCECMGGDLISCC